MYLADHQQYNQKFELVIIKPDDRELVSELNMLFRGLSDLPPYTSYYYNDKPCWAFFDLENDRLCEQVKQYIKDRAQQLVHYEDRFSNQYESYCVTQLYDGVEIFEDVEVECVYFYDDPSRYA